MSQAEVAYEDKCPRRKDRYGGMSNEFGGRMNKGDTKGSDWQTTCWLEGDDNQRRKGPAGAELWLVALVS